EQYLAEATRDEQARVQAVALRPSASIRPVQGGNRAVPSPPQAASRVVPAVVSSSQAGLNRPLLESLGSVPSSMN
ncbi:pilus assembly protein, partial [Providencia rettgeri]|nr:pilus assembly protein [Providencia rettgeri]